MTQEEARQLFDYDAEEGVLRWRVGRNTGGVAGAVHKRIGYRIIMIRRGYSKTYYAHRLIWLWMYGEWPVGVDHINMKRDDNRLSNLREATQSENLANQRVRSKTGFKGVWRHGSGWAASIRKDKTTRHLGTYPSPELAHAAYCEAAKAIYGEFARSE